MYIVTNNSKDAITRAAISFAPGDTKHKLTDGQYAQVTAHPHLSARPHKIDTSVRAKGDK